ncbi:MAG: DUF4268 domain-containing protein [Anaerolineaceae bacterium]|nr:DUF4268 domain-containing protein [Anaerolineaceae bacterium]
MPFLVKNLIENQSNVVCVKKDDLVSKAYQLMIENDFSQLPVLDDDNHPIGMITHESILKGIKNLNSTMDEIHVRDVITKPPTTYEDDDLFDVLDLLKSTNAVLIEKIENRMPGIVTSYDAMEYFRNRTENLMIVEDIETNIKMLIRHAYSLEENQPDNENIKSVIRQISSSEKNNNKVNSFDELTLYEYIHILFHDNTWKVVGSILDFDKKNLRKMFEGVRSTRNDLAHFRTIITSDQISELKFCGNWLTNRIADWENSKQHQEAETSVALEAASIVTSPPEISKPTLSVDDSIKFEDYSPKESRYSPLIDYLTSQPGNIDFVNLPFEKIETIISGELPNSARNHRAWWANDTVGHPHSISWLEAGWKVKSVNFNEQHVTFARIKEREIAYIDFFSQLLKDLAKKAEFPIKELSPSGTNWIVISAIPKNRPKYGLFVFSFSRINSFRVELYLDLNDKEKTKKVYDAICKQKIELEEKIGSISWERLNEKRASRIAIYHDGSVLDNKDKLAKLRSWAVETMIKFYGNLAEITEQEILNVLSQ